MTDQRTSTGTESAHTPLPWSAAKSRLNDLWTVYCSKTKNIAAVQDPYGHDDEVAQANAAFIVKAVNSHAGLVKALEDIAAIEPTEGNAAKNRGAMVHMQSIARAALSQVRP